MSKWTVAPEQVRIDLVDPVDGESFWIAIKKQLTVGEDKFVKTAGMKSVSGFGQQQQSGQDREVSMNINWKMQSLARAATYLVDWSLADGNGNRLRVSMDTIEALRPDIFEVIENAITKHVEAQETEKKALSGSGRPSAT